MYGKQKAEKFKDNMIVAAFYGWQVKDSGKSFTAYLRDYGLTEKKKSQELTPEQKKREIDKSLAIAEKIMNGMKKT